eukprot:8828603-Pyramimonas_sp.AAC.1
MDKWGYQVPTACPTCGALDTLFHRIWQCPFGACKRNDVVCPELIHEARAAGPTNPLYARSSQPKPELSEFSPDWDLRFAGADGLPTDPLWFEAGARSSTDGSCTDPTDPFLARAGLAAVQ